jgi:hypothetical protein
MRIIPRRLIVLAALSCGICWGCGPAGSGTLTGVIPVKGKVTYKGQPLTKGSIKFEPDGYGREAHGTIQSDGTFVLTTFKDGDGVVAGHHRVAVTETGIKSPKDALARKYGFVESSGLTADVDAEHTEFTFDLK